MQDGRRAREPKLRICWTCGSKDLSLRSVPAGLCQKRGAGLVEERSGEDPYGTDKSGNCNAFEATQIAFSGDVIKIEIPIKLRSALKAYFKG